MTIAARLRRVRSLLGRGTQFALVLGLHLALLGWVGTATLRPGPAEELARLDLRIIDEAPAATRTEPQRPSPAQRAVQPAQTSQPAPVMAATEAVAAPAAFAVSPQPLSAPAAAIAAPRPPLPAPVPAAVTPARFDADYLRNPPPVYPRAARRYGDQGRVLLKVLVSAQGAASAIRLEASSGHARLDEAAEETVRQWRFLPARRGTEAIDDWVLVPVVFRLDS